MEYEEISSDEIGKKLESLIDKYYDWAEKIEPKILDGVIKKLDGAIDIYKHSSKKQRKSIRKSLPSEVGPLLIVYSEKLAVSGVKQLSLEVLKDGIIALAIEDGRLYGRDQEGFYETTKAIALLYHSVKKIGENPDLVFKEVASISGRRTSKLLSSYTKKKKRWIIERGAIGSFLEEGHCIICRRKQK